MLKIPHDEIRRIAIFRALNLGDLLCAIPAIRALKSSYPEARINLIGLPWMAEFAMRFRHYFDGFASFPGVAGLPEQAIDLDAFTEFLHRERQADYDLVLQMHGKGSVTNPVVAMFGARRLAGYNEPGEYCPDPETFMPYPEGLPEIERHLALMNFLGITSKGRGLEFPVTDDEWREVANLRNVYGISDRPYVCIHPGARDMCRWWAPRKFAQVADAIAAKGVVIIFTGTNEEHSAVERVRKKMDAPSINLAGRTGLGVLGALIGQASLLVSNDTGVSHIAAAMGTPSVVIFLTSDPARWAPLDRELHHVITPDESENVAGVVFRAETALHEFTHRAAPWMSKIQETREI